MGLRSLFAAIFGAVCACAQPAIFPKGVVNSASFAPPGVPSGAIARGSTFSIFGTGLGPAQPAQQPSYPLQKSIGGVSISVSQGSTSVDALPVFVTAGIVNAIMPSNAPLGAAAIRVTFNGQTSNPSPVTVVNNSPGLFTSTGTGIGIGSIQNLSGDQAPLNSPIRSATPGQFVTLWATGLGPISQSDADAPPIGSLPTSVEIFVGGVQAANIVYSGRTPCCAGIDQIVFQIPDNAPQTCFVPVLARVAGSAVSNTVTMSIKANGGTCSDPANALSSVLTKGGKLGAVALTHRVEVDDVLNSPAFNVTYQQGLSYFAQYPGSEFAFQPLLALPPAGTCTTYVRRKNAIADLPGSAGKDLSTGAVSVTGGSGPVTFDRIFENNLNFDHGLLGLNQIISRITPNLIPLYLSGGNTYHVSAAGSADIGAFAIELPMAAPINWTNRDQTMIVDRSKDLTITWTGAGNVTIVGSNSDLPTDSSGSFVCTAPAGATSFTIPAMILANLPASRFNLAQSEGQIEIHSAPAGMPTAFKAPQAAGAVALSESVSRRAVVFH